MADLTERAFDWEDEIENDGQEWTVIPEGDYHFGVLFVERGRHDGSEKIPPCPKAVVRLAILGPEYPFKPDRLGEVSVNLFLHSRFEWKLCQFFTSIGLRRHGEKLKMDWNRATGAEGDCHIGIRKWTGRDGKEHEGNEVTEFYDPDKSPLRAQDMDQPEAGISYASPRGGSYTPGRF